MSIGEGPSWDVCGVLTSSYEKVERDPEFNFFTEAMGFGYPTAEIGEHPSS